MDHYIQIFTTTETKEDAQRIAHNLVERRLAGCVQILGPIESNYWWEGNVETAAEWLCLIKSRQELYSEAEAAITAIHPYETPEILAMPVGAGSQDYLQWLQSELKTAGN